jgi:hypothetical protein
MNGRHSYGGALYRAIGLRCHRSSDHCRRIVSASGLGSGSGASLASSSTGSDIAVDLDIPQRQREPFPRTGRTIAAHQLFEVAHRQAGDEFKAVGRSASARSINAPHRRGGIVQQRPGEFGGRTAAAAERRRWS